MVEDQNGRFDIHCVVLSCRGEVVRGLLLSPRRKPRDADRSFVPIKRYETVRVTSNHTVDMKASRLQAPPFCILEPGLPKYLWGEPVCHPGKAQLSTIKHLVGASSSSHRKQTLEFWKPHKVFKNKSPLWDKWAFCPLGLRFGPRPIYQGGGQGGQDISKNVRAVSLRKVFLKKKHKWSFACGLTKECASVSLGYVVGLCPFFPGDLHLGLPVVFHTGEEAEFTLTGLVLNRRCLDWQVRQPPFITKSDESASRTIGHASCCAVQLYIRLSVSSVERHKSAVQVNSHTHTLYGEKSWWKTSVWNNRAWNSS